jgi:hypothetical protein
MANRKYKFRSDESVEASAKRRKKLVRGVKKVAKGVAKAAETVTDPFKLGQKTRKWAKSAEGCYDKARKRGLSRAAAAKLCAVGTKAANKALKKPDIRR